MSLRRRGDSSQFWLVISWTIQPNLSRCIQPPVLTPSPWGIWSLSCLVAGSFLSEGYKLLC